MAQQEKRERKRIINSSAISVGLFLLLFGCMGTLFAWPWTPPDPIGGATLNQYVPIEDGHAALYQIQDDGGALAGWASVNQSVLPIAPALIGLEDAQLIALSELYGNETFSADFSAELANEGARFVRLVERRVDENGRFLHQTEQLIFRNADGDYLLQERDGAQNLRLWDPPLRLFDAERVRNGRLQTAHTNAQSVVSTAATSFNLEAAAQQFDNCIEQTVAVTENGVESEQVRVYCEEIGLVYRADRQSGESLHLISTNEQGVLAAEFSFPTMSLVQPSSRMPFGGENGRLTLLTQMEDGVGSLEPSIPPTVVGAERPYLLAAQVNDVLNAYALDNGELLWTFKTGATIFGAPLVDTERGRVYFGASDKKLYALDANGLFLWAVTTADNVVTKPALIDNQLLFGSEDGKIYCVDVKTGRVLGQVETGGAVVASPAVAGNTAVFGADDGGVYAIDAPTCTRNWLFDAGDAVEASLMIEQNVVYVVGRGLLVALDLPSGEPLWAQEPEDVYRYAPILLDDRLLAIDQFDKLAAYDRENGRLLWTKGDPLFRGTPLFADAGVIVMGDDAIIFLLDKEGNILHELPLPAVPNENDVRLMFWTHGLEGDVWLVDDLSRIFRLTEG